VVVSGVGRERFGLIVVGERETKEVNYRAYSCMLVTREMGFC